MTGKREPLMVQVPTALSLMMQRRWFELTEPQQRLLQGADECTPPNERAVKFGWSGIGARGASVRVAARLIKLGYLEFVDYGRSDEDDNGDDERPIYAITDAGRDVLRAVGKSATPTGANE